jgi:hypothetical protein
MRNPYVWMAVAAFLVWTQWRMAGKMLPKAAVAVLSFYATRWPLLLGWVACAAGMWLLGRSALQSLTGGLMFGTVAAAVPFYLLRAFATPPALELEPGEVVIRELAGNHYLRGERRAGKLLLTNRRIGFRPSRFSVQLSPWSMRLDDIRSVRLEGMSFLVVDGDAPRPPEWLVAVEGQKMAEQLDEVRRRPEAERSPS